MRLIVHAPNVHGGGGKVLLLAALKGVATDQPCTLIADRRLETTALPAHIDVKAFTPTLSGRFAAERHLRSIARPDDVVLCMGNLPPLLECPARVKVFLQNRYLCDDVSLRGFPPAVRCRVLVERLWLRMRLHPRIQVLVQTRSMQQAVQRALGRHALLRPFFDVAASTGRADQQAGLPRFLYPASGEPHKNHAVLLTAWRHLQRWDVAAELHLTVEGRSPLAADIERARAEGLPVVNHGHVDPQELHRLYQTCTALIYPSLLESFGLPLLEAQAAHLPIVAAELDYVRDVVDPTETFDPQSPVSLARAVMRLLGTPEPHAARLMPAEFISCVVSEPA